MTVHPKVLTQNPKPVSVVLVKGFPICCTISWIVVEFFIVLPPFNSGINMFVLTILIHQPAHTLLQSSASLFVKSSFEIVPINWSRFLPGYCFGGSPDNSNMKSKTCLCCSSESGLSCFTISWIVVEFFHCSVSFLAELHYKHVCPYNSDSRNQPVCSTRAISIFRSSGSLLSSKSLPFDVIVPKIL